MNWNFQMNTNRSDIILKMRKIIGMHFKQTPDHVAYEILANHIYNDIISDILEQNEDLLIRLKFLEKRKKETKDFIDSQDMYEEYEDYLATDWD